MILATGFQGEARNLIEYNGNNLEVKVNEEEKAKKEAIHIEFTELKAGFKNNKNPIDFGWSDV